MYWIINNKKVNDKFQNPMKLGWYSNKQKYLFHKWIWMLFTAASITKLSHKKTPTGMFVKLQGGFLHFTVIFSNFIKVFFILHIFRLWKKIVCFFIFWLRTEATGIDINDLLKKWNWLVTSGNFPSKELYFIKMISLTE